MEIKALNNTTLQVIVECLSESFKNYFVKMPSDVSFWEKRFKAARVDYNLSFGVFDQEKLVAFIIHGIDRHNGQMTAFNTGTGVLESHRGLKLVDKIYDYALPVLKRNNIQKCMLEVIEENHVAVRVYERIGFKKDRFLRCFKGQISNTESTYNILEIDIDSIKDKIETFQKFYSWDHTFETIQKGGTLFKSYLVKSKNGNDLGYFVTNTSNNALVQIEEFGNGTWIEIISATRQIIPQIRINNIDSHRVDLIKAFLDVGLENHINQFEMDMPI
ncbi:MAG: GNAT family N-acetyltransferase [Bacteroidota bacterium]